MRDQRTFATFRADLPDDSQFSESGDIVVPGGCGVCLTLAQALMSAGFSVSEPMQHEFYGWEMTAESGGQKCWLLLQGGDPWLLIIEIRRGILGWLRKSNSSSIDVLAAIDFAIKSNPIIGNVSWFTRDEYEKGNQIGNSTP